MYAPFLNYGPMENIPAVGAVHSARDASMFCDEHSSACSYIFHESAPADWPGGASPDVRVATNRSVHSNASCDSYVVSRGGDGLGHTITLNDAAKTEVRLPALSGPNQTLFMTTATDSSRNRWSLVDVFHASTTDAWYYRCNTSLSRVRNTQIGQHEVSDLIASFALAAITLQDDGPTSRLSHNVKPQKQFRIYSTESLCGLSQLGDNIGMAKLLSRFAIGAVASVAKYNNFLVAPGLTPLKSVRLEVPSWGWVHIILGLVTAIQPLLAISAACFALCGHRRASHSRNRAGGILQAAKVPTSWK